MEVKRRKSSTDDARTSNVIEYESEKQQRKKRKITEDDVALKVEKMIKSRNVNKSSHLPLKIMYSGKEEKKKQSESTKESETYRDDGRNICEKFVLGKNIEGDVTETRPTDMKFSHLPLKIMYSGNEERKKQRESTKEIETYRVDGRSICEKFVQGKNIEGDVTETRPTDMKYSHLSLEIKYSVIEEKRREIERKREILKVRSREEKMIKKREHEERMAFWARVRGQQRPAEFLGLQLTTVTDVKNLLQGKSHNELKLLQSEVQLQMCFSSANDVEYWETVLQLIHVYKVKACLDIHGKIFGKFYGQEYRNLSNAGSDGKNDQAGTGVAEGTGSSCSPELLHCEETGDNFEMKTMGIMEEGDALSGNNYDEVNCQSQVCWLQNKCRPLIWVE